MSAAEAGAQEKKENGDHGNAGLGAVVLPVLFNMPETKWGGGVGGLLTFRPAGIRTGSRPSSLYFYAIITQLKQFSTKWEPEAYFRSEAFLVKGKFQFEIYPEKYWGLGPDTAEESEQDYTPRSFILEASFQRKIWAAGNLYAGPLLQVESYKVLKSEPGGPLEDEHPSGAAGGTSSGGGFIVNWDTRDNVFCPRDGKSWQLSAVFNHPLLGSGFRYAALKLDLRQYLPLFSSHTLALQALCQSVIGEAPFKSLPKLGGDSLMRGYYSGRYRDRSLYALQAEYRLPLWWRFGLAGFAGLGNVGSGPGRLSLDGAKVSLGAGLRFKVAPREGTNLRLDFAWGRGTSGFYFTAGEAF
jgi:outer membrane protein assembly factor BamA